MNFTSRPNLLRTACGAAALLATWVLVAANGSPVAVGLGAFATIAVLAAVLWPTGKTEAAPEVPFTHPTSLHPPVVPEPEVTFSASDSRIGNAVTVLSILADPVIAYDGLFRIVYANEPALNLFGLTREEIEQFVVTPQLAQQDARYTRLVQVVYPSLAPVVTPREAPAGSKAQVVDISFSDPELDLRVTTAELPGYKGFLKIIRDRTRTLSIIRSKTEFVTVASHQLRTPLTEISWALESLAASTTMAVDDKALVTQTLESVRTLTSLAEDLLGVAKIEEGRFGYRFEPQDVVAILDAELSKALPIVEAAGIKLFFDRPATPLPNAYVDREKFTMVLNNLVENALRYNVKNGEITVKAEIVEGESFIKVSVRDTGIGIARDDVDKLFTKFFRAENATRAVASGSGLGLYIASNIVRAHGGQMGVASELGRGTTFSFTVSTDQRRVPQHEVSVVEV